MENYGYLYAYFRSIRPGKDMQQIYFAVSKDGLHFTPLNNNQPILYSQMGTKAVRDPHLVRSEIDGKFYLLATDLDVNRNRWREYMMRGSKHIMVWTSEDLVHWSEQSMPKLVDEHIGCVWAPKVCYDEKAGDYAVFFSGSEAGTTILKIFCCRTKDFISYSEPRVLIDKKENTEKLKCVKFLPAPKWVSFIDSTTVPVGNSFYRFTKNETTRTVQIEKSRELTEGYTLIQPVVAGEKGVEGPCIYKLFDQDRWVLLLDGHFGPNMGVGYFPLTATSAQLETGEFTRLRPEEYTLPEGCKHGSVIPITRSEYERLSERFA